jgi:hypothetical protein
MQYQSCPLDPFFKSMVTKLTISISHASPCDMHPNLPKISKQCRAKKTIAKSYHMKKCSFER